MFNSNWKSDAYKEGLKKGFFIPLPATTFSFTPPSRLLGTCYPDPAMKILFLHASRGSFST